MQAHIEPHPVLLVCLVAGNVAEWAIRHGTETDGETFQDISFDGESVTMYTDTGREVTFPEAIHMSYAESSACDIHMIQEFDSRGNIGREYAIKPPVIAQVAGYRG